MSSEYVKREEFEKLKKQHELLVLNVLLTKAQVHQALVPGSERSPEEVQSYMDLLQEKKQKIISESKVKPLYKRITEIAEEE